MLKLHICSGWKCVRCTLTGMVLSVAILMVADSHFSPVGAQIRSDVTLENESSIVIDTPNGLRLEGGAIRGTGLFHSFADFNIESGQSVYFVHPSSVANILTRVTGNQPSAIDGTLGVEGTANLFLINPNGIVFGDNAQLDMAGSFTAATVDSLWVDGYEFSAIQPESPVPLLSLSVTPGIQYGAIANSLLTNTATLTVGEQQQLTLLGGTVTNQGALIAPGGEVELSGHEIAQIGTVETRLADGRVGTLLIDPKDILIQAGTPTSGDDISQALAGNNVVLQADNDITVDDDIISTSENNLTLLAGRSVALTPDRSIVLNGGDFIVRFNDQPVNPVDRDSGIAQFLMQPGSEILTNSGLVSITSGTFGQISEVETTGGTINTTQPGGSGNDITLVALSDIATGSLITGLQNPISPFLEPQTVNSGNITIRSQQGNITTTDVLFAEAQIEGGDIILDAANDLTILDNISTRGRTKSGNLTFTNGNTLSIIRGDERLSVDTRIDGAGSPGNVLLAAPTIVLEDSIVVAVNASDVQGGNVQVNANEVLLRNGRIATLAFLGSGDAGDLIMNTDRLTIVKEPDTVVTEGVGIATTASFGSLGDGGDITINATEFVDISADVPGPFVPTPNQILQAVLQNDTGIVASGIGRGSSGTISVNTERLSVREGSGLITASIAGQGGDININASTVELEGAAGFLTATSVVGLDAGDLSMQAEQVELKDGAFLGTATISNEGQAGRVDLSTQQLSIQNGSVISLATLGRGEGGRAIIEATDLIEITGTSADGTISSGIQANSLGTGDAGTMEITTGEFRIRDGATVTVSGEGEGDAGNIGIGARLLFLDQGNITATSASGTGGNVVLQIDELLLLRNGSAISTTAGQTGTRGDGGNITIGKGFIIAVPGENSDITANAFEGNGGNIAIATQGLLGIEFRENLTPLSDITASSQFGLDGDVAIEQFNPNIEPADVVLPDQLAAADQITARCAIPANPANSLVTTGRGGLPSDPRQLRQGNRVLHDWRRPNRSTTADEEITLPMENIVEAQTWQVNAQGQVQLVARAPQSAHLITTDCATSQEPV